MTPSITQLIIVLAIVVLLFGTKKLRNMGGDMGSAINNFKKAMKGGEKDADEALNGKLESKEGEVVDAKASEKEKDQA